MRSSGLLGYSSYLILGAGESGLAAASLVSGRGARVIVAGKRRAGDPEAARLADMGVVFTGEDLCVSAKQFCASCECPYDAVAVISPGIPYSSDAVRVLEGSSVRVAGELEMGVSCLSQGTKVVAVTGSKGKSSLVKLISDSLNLAGMRSVPCGNYGTAVSRVAVMEGVDAAVVECSSFQLESLHGALGADASVVLNVSPDHLDRHGTMDAYADVKMRIFGGCPAERCFVPGPSSDEYRLAGRSSSMFGRSPVTFGVSDDCFWEWRPGCVVNRDGFCVPISGTYFDNRILGPAAAAGAAVLSSLGLDERGIGHGFACFEPLPHRMQRVAEKNGVLFVDDSKATSLSALAAGCAMSQKPVFLIAGGRLKEKPIDLCKEFVTYGVRKVYLIGESSSELASVWKDGVSVSVCGVLENAVSEAYADAVSAGGGTVLLSPGTASFDQFASYAERGEKFSCAVCKL